ncbi:exosome non-catalytic core subunit rrp40 [Blyttiomyces sp. JEL0837]|nr:exosome non-catalytic core subunit rrp40 [Blyttiomyces sp. JEL0837]
MDTPPTHAPPFTVVLPGDRIPIPSSPSSASPTASTTSTIPSTKLKLGPGMRQENNEIVVMKQGLLKWGPSSEKVWVEGSQRRYVPQLGERVLGVIISRHAENYRVDIAGAHVASLGAFAFEGATKKNKPNLEIGTIVYGRVSLANKDMEPEIECVNPSNGKADGFGEMKGGFMFKCSLGLARSLLKPQNPVLQAMGKLFAFEIAVGMNGRVWVDSGNARHVVMLVNAIKGSENVAPAKMSEYVKSLGKSFEDVMDVE